MKLQTLLGLILALLSCLVAAEKQPEQQPQQQLQQMQPTQQLKPLKVRQYHAKQQLHDEQPTVPEGDDSSLQFKEVPFESNQGTLRVIVGIPMFSTYHKDRDRNDKDEDHHYHPRPPPYPYPPYGGYPHYPPRPPTGPTYPYPPYPYPTYPNYPQYPPYYPPYYPYYPPWVIPRPPILLPDTEGTGNRSGPEQETTENTENAVETDKTADFRRSFTPFEDFSYEGRQCRLLQPHGFICA